LCRQGTHWKTLADPKFISLTTIQVGKKIKDRKKRVSFSYCFGFVFFFFSFPGKAQYVAGLNWLMGSQPYETFKEYLKLLNIRLEKSLVILDSLGWYCDITNVFIHQ
jgi:hypothetical protein